MVQPSGVVEVGLSWNWSRVRRDGIIACLTSKGHHLLTDRMRRLFGLEALRLQGMNFSPEIEDILKTFADELLVDLAGNAFSTRCFLVVYIGLISILHQQISD